MLRTAWASCVTVVRQHRPRRRLVPLPGRGKNQTQIHADARRFSLYQESCYSRAAELPDRVICGIGEICGHLRLVFSGHPGREAPSSQSQWFR